MTPENYLPRMTLNNHQSCFNAFALGFADMAMEDEIYGLSHLAHHLPAYQKLLDRLGMPSWDLFVEYLNALYDDPTTLQEQLAYVFAGIVLEPMSKDALFNDIKTVFINYMLGRCGIKLSDDGGDADQQLAQFPFMRQCFEDVGRYFLREKRTANLKLSKLIDAIEEKCLESLKQWWTDSGYKHYIKQAVRSQEQLHSFCFELLEAAFKIRVLSPTEVPVDLGDEHATRQIEMKQKTKNQWEYFQHPRLGKIQFPVIQADQAKQLLGSLKSNPKKLKTSDEENDPMVITETVQKLQATRLSGI